MPIGNFNYASHKLLLSYDSGATEEVALGEEMIAPEDVFKFYQEGEHTITALYGGQKCEFKVLVKRATFGELSFRFFLTFLFF